MDYFSQCVGLQSCCVLAFFSSVWSEISSYKTRTIVSCIFFSLKMNDKRKASDYPMDSYKKAKEEITKVSVFILLFFLF